MKGDTSRERALSRADKLEREAARLRAAVGPPAAVRWPGPAIDRDHEDLRAKLVPLLQDLGVDAVDELAAWLRNRPWRLSRGSQFVIRSDSAGRGLLLATRRTLAALERYMQVVVDFNRGPRSGSVVDDYRALMDGRTDDAEAAALLVLAAALTATARVLADHDAAPPDAEAAIARLSEWKGPDLRRLVEDNVIEFLESRDMKTGNQRAARVLCGALRAMGLSSMGDDPADEKRALMRARKRRRQRGPVI